MPSLTRPSSCTSAWALTARHADQQVRGAVVLPNGTGKNVRVIAICKGDAAKAAEAAGAQEVGDDDLIAKIQGGYLDFDVLVTTPDMMGRVGRLGKILGPRGLMPNPKAGTVTPDVGRAVTEAKAGKIEYRLDKQNIIHVAHRQGFLRRRQADDQPWTPSWKPSPRPSPPPPRASTSRAPPSPPPWGPGVRGQHPEVRRLIFAQTAKNNA